MQDSFSAGTHLALPFKLFPFGGFVGPEKVPVHKEFPEKDLVCYAGTLGCLKHNHP